MMDGDAMYYVYAIIISISTKSYELVDVLMMMYSSDEMLCTMYMLSSTDYCISMCSDVLTV